MAADSHGPKNEPQYAETGASADAADLTEIAAYAAKVGNRKADTSAVRTALTGADLWPGLEFYETDTGATYVYSSGWKLRHLPLTSWTPTVGNVSTSSVYAKYRVTDGVVTAFIRIVVTGAPSTNPTASLPLSADTSAPTFIGISANMQHTTTTVSCLIWRTSATQCAWYPQFSSGSPAYVQLGTSVDANHPFAWQSTDVIEATITYPLP